MVKGNFYEKVRRKPERCTVIKCEKTTVFYQPPIHFCHFQVQIAIPYRQTKRGAGSQTDQRLCAIV